jgi:hypothetical protein
LKKIFLEIPKEYYNKIKSHAETTPDNSPIFSILPFSLAIIPLTP